MWPFTRKRTLGDIGIFNGLTDCHSHILPGVDDGVRTMEESLAILDRYERLGMKTVWLTPHIMEDVPNKTADLKNASTSSARITKEDCAFTLGRRI